MIVIQSKFTMLYRS